MVEESDRALLVDDPVVRIAKHRNLLAVAWFGLIRVEHLLMAEAAGRDLARIYPSKTAMLNIIVLGAPPTDAAVRETMSRLAREPMLFRAGAAHVMLTPGVVGAAARTFVSTVLLVAKPPTPTRMLPSLDSAAAWLEPKLNAVTPGWTKAEIIEVGRRVMRR